MPMWEWFAFYSSSASSAILHPAQQAIRDHNLSAWQTVYDQLSQTHVRPYLSPYGSPLGYSPNKATIIVPGGAGELSRDEIPDESALSLRKVLQTFIEHASSLRIEGRFPRARHWVMNEIPWPKILESKAERDELELFKSEIIAGRKKIPDPFWCLESDDAVDSNFVPPEVVAKLADVEETVGLFRGLVRRNDLGTELHELARDVAAAGLLIELAAAQGLALFFREDAT